MSPCQIEIQPENPLLLTYMEPADFSIAALGQIQKTMQKREFVVEFQVKQYSFSHQNKVIPGRFRKVTGSFLVQIEKVGSYIGENIIRGKVWSLDGKYQIGTITNVYADSAGKLEQTADELIVDLQITNPAVLRVLKSHIVCLRLTTSKIMNGEIGTIRVVQAE